jgi:hypothetical protein
MEAIICKLEKSHKRMRVSLDGLLRLGDTSLRVIIL